MADLSDPHQLEAVLEALGANNTQTIRQAEETLKPFLKKAIAVPCLMRQIEGSSKVAVRHVASLILKKKINVLYSHISRQDQAAVKAQLLHLLVSESVKVIRTAIAGVVAALAKNVLVADHNWPEMFDLLLQLVQNPQDNMRALCFSLLGQLVEKVPEYLKPHLETICNMFLSGFGDANHDVAISAISAANAYIAVLADQKEVMKFQPLLTPMLQVLDASLQKGLEEVVVEAFDLFQECAGMKQPLINDHVQFIIPFALNVIRSNAEPNVKSAASNTVLHIVEYRPNLIGKSQLVLPIFNALLEMCAESSNSAIGGLFLAGFGGANDQEDDGDDKDVDAHEAAQICMDKMAHCIPSKLFVQPALSLCSQYITSQNPRQRKAGCTALAVIAEGCSDVIRAMMGEILPVVLKCVYDGDEVVRECATFCVGQFSEHCQPEILYQHQQVFPAMFAALDDSSVNVQCTSCYVLENFCENLQVATLRPFLDQLVNRLLSMMNRGQRAQEMAILALSSAAIAAESDFLPYAQSTITMIQPFFWLSDVKQYNLRGRSLECLGHIAIAIGGQSFLPYFEGGMQVAMNGTQLEDDGLREYAYVFIANVAKVCGPQLVPMLPDLVPHLLAVLAEAEFSPDSEANAEEGMLNGLADEDEGEVEQDYVRLIEDAPFISAKKSAISAVGALAEHCGAAYFPYIDKTLSALIGEGGVTESYHRLLREEAMLALWYLVKAVCAHEGPTNPPPRGVTIPLTDVAKYVVGCALGTLLNCIAGDYERKVVCAAVEGFNGILAIVGCAGLHIVSEHQSVGEVLMHNINVLLTEQAPCQTINKHEEEEDEDIDDHDLVIGAMADLIGGLAKTMGELFLPHFQNFFKLMMKFTKKSRTYGDREVAIGAFAEVMAFCGPQASAQYAELLLPHVKDWLSDSTETVRRNCCYLVGVLAENATAVLSPHYVGLLQLLHPLCLRQSNDVQLDVGGADVDNALSAVAKMIKSAPQAIPLAHVIPVVVNSLPVRSDFGESANIYGMLCGLIENGEPTTRQLLPQILNIFAHSLYTQHKDEEEARVLIKTCLQHFSSVNRDVFAAAVSQIPDSNVRGIIQQAASS